MQEVSDVLLSVARIWSFLAQGATRNFLRLLEKDHATEEEEKRSWEEERGPRVTEISEQEVREIEAGKHNSVTGTRPADAATAEPRRRRHHTYKPRRILWQPLQPRLFQALASLPQTAQTHPLQIGAAAGFLLPISPAVLVTIPGLLATDHVLQSLYTYIGEDLEMAVDTGVQMGRLRWTVARLSARQTYRVARRQLKALNTDPAKVAEQAMHGLTDAACHPLRSARFVWGVGKGAALNVVGFTRWTYAQVQATRGFGRDVRGTGGDITGGVVDSGAMRN